MDQNEFCEEIANLFKSLGNVKRLEIVRVLTDGEKKVGELEQYIGISQSALSQHLAVLRTAGVVTTRRCAQSIFYSLNYDKCQIISSAWKQIFRCRN